MALLGREGILELQREVAPPIVLPSSQLSIANNRFTINSENFWNADAVKIYGDSNNVVTVLSGFFGKDTLGNASLYSTQDGALNRSPSKIVSLGGLRSTRIMLAHDTSSTHALFLTDYFRRYLFDSSISVTKEFSLTEDPENYQQYKNSGPPYLPWKIQATIRNWQLNIQTPDIDTTSIGERFRDSIKSVLSGSGSLDFLVDIYAEPSIDDSTSLLRLALMLEYGIKGNTRFYLSPDVSEADPRRTSKGLPSSNKKLYYSTKILLTNSTVDTSSDGLIVGSADFVTTGPVRLGVDVEKEVTYTYDPTGTEFGAFRYYSGHTQDSVNVNAAIAENGDYYVGNGARNTGTQGSTPPLGFSLVKFGRSSLLWPNWSKLYKVLDDYTYVNFGYMPRIDKQGNLWGAFCKINGTLARYKICLAKIDPGNGSVASSFCITVPVTFESPSNAFFVDYDFDNDGNIYLGTQWRDSNGNFHPCIVKVLADGVIGWVRRLGKASGNRGDHSLLRVKVLNNEVTVGCKNTRGETITGTYTRAASFYKMNLDGSTKISPACYTAQTDISSTTQADARVQAMDVAPDGSIYAIYLDRENSLGTGNTQLYVMKVNPNLTPAWAYALNHGPSSVNTGANAMFVRDVHVDNQGRIFFMARAINTSFTQLAPCKTWNWNSNSYNWGAGISEMDSSGNYLSVRYYNTTSTHQDSFNAYSLYGFDNSVRFARTAGNTATDYIPLTTNTSAARGGTSISYAQNHVLAKKDGQFGSWGEPCETRFIGDYGMAVFGYTPQRSSALGFTQVGPSTSILTDNFNVQSDSSYVIAEDFPLTTAVTGFTVGD